jgi:adenylate kinase family enzyme
VWKQQITRTRALFQNISALFCSDSELCKWLESQRRHQAQESRRESAEKRKQELHQWAVLLAESKVSHQQVLTLNAEMDVHEAAAAQNRPMKLEQAA